MNDNYFVGLILKDLSLEKELREAWANAGTSGITTLDCEGESLGRVAFTRDDIPLFPSLSSFMSGDDEEQKFLFTIVQSSEALKLITEVTQTITGDLNQPGKGILFAWPLTFAIGLR